MICLFTCLLSLLLNFEITCINQPSRICYTDLQGDKLLQVNHKTNVDYWLFLELSGIVLTVLGLKTAKCINDHCLIDVSCYINGTFICNTAALTQTQGWKCFSTCQTLLIISTGCNKAGHCFSASSYSQPITLPHTTL